MKKNYITKKLLGLCSATLVLQCGVSSNPVQGQIVPDATLPSNSQVTDNGTTFTIDGGTVRTRNHFHSFREFSIPTGREAFFNNAATIENIITRVTGGEISNIDGLIRANGGANVNLFLLNPNGIVFGPNARLDIGGSFFGSTADSLLFNDGSIYSATDPASQPLLTINVPIGLQWNGPQSGAIRVVGTGNNLGIEVIRFSPILGAGQSDSGLRVNPGKTLALVGGNVTFDGGILTAPGGRVELGAPGRGLVELNAFDGSLNYDGVESFGDILLQRQSLLDASGIGRSAIQVQGRSLELRDGSLIFIQNQGNLPDGSLVVNARDYLVVSGVNSAATISSSLMTESLGKGNSGNIAVFTGNLILEKGGFIATRSYSQGSAGDVTTIALESAEFVGFLPANPIFTSSIASTTASTISSSGDTGNIAVSTRRLTIRDGGNISSAIGGTGQGQNAIVNATESIEVIGINMFNFFPSTVSGGTIGEGNAADVTINTSSLAIRDGGAVTTSTTAGGNAGSLTINATDFVEVSGFAAGSVLTSQISSGAIIPDEATRVTLGLPDVPTGEAGNVTINTPELRLNSAVVSVRNEGEGNAGNLEVNANAIFLDSEGAITASTRAGSGGNIILQVPSRLQLRGGSQISAAAGGIGNGGNLIVNANTVVALSDSNITANAFSGTGGNISITTNGIFASPDSNITASSQLGIDGTVTVSTPDVDSSSVLVELPSQFQDPRQQIVTGCAGGEENSFSVTGRGGLAEDPTDIIRGTTLWRDMEDYSVESNDDRNSQQDVGRAGGDRSLGPLVEATGWIKHPDGTIELVAHLGPVTSPGLKPVSCQDLSSDD